MNRIANIVIYTGHQTTDILGPYKENIQKRLTMFTEMNRYREEIGREPWCIFQATGEELTHKLTQFDPCKTLLVIPAGQSTHLDTVFTIAQTRFLKDTFFQQGGRIYVNCGSAYWSSKKRIYDDVCLVQPENPKTLIKKSNFTLFEGTAIGPLCPFPGHKYKVGFFSDAIEIEDGEDECTIFLSGGGSFILPKETEQDVKVLLRYKESELIRIGKPEAEKWKNAAILAKVGRGAALMSMFHPYYGPQDIDTDRYEKALPNCGTNWRQVHERLTPTDKRMRFVLKTMILPLEDVELEQPSG